MDGTVSEPRLHGDFKYINPENIDQSRQRPPAKSTLAGLTFYPEYDNVVIRRDDLPVRPHWDGASQNPPLSAKHALRLAGPVIARVERRDDKLRNEWEKSPELALTKLAERWFWHVTYTWMPRSGVLGGRPPIFSMAVLMDGKVIAPTPIKP
jgi:hypothetical protein